jgi:predicted DNA binding CopG/RHH family protein
MKKIDQFKIKLTAEEQAIEDSFERGEYQWVTGKELEEILESLAAHRKKNRMMTIRVNSYDIERIRKVAESKGVPYQSFISEILHNAAEKLSRSLKLRIK